MRYIPLPAAAIDELTDRFHVPCDIDEQGRSTLIISRSMPRQHDIIDLRPSSIPISIAGQRPDNQRLFVYKSNAQFVD